LQKKKQNAPEHLNFGIYQPRNPQKSDYYRCVQDHFKQLEMHWQDRYSSRYGFWRPYVTVVIYRYLDCGDLHLLRGCDAKNAATNTGWPILANAATSAPLATKSAWWNSASGSAPRY
jgi:hypothetical protein